MWERKRGGSEDICKAMETEVLLEIEWCQMRFTEQ